MIEEFRPNFVMMIGLPGSGKSTMTREFLARENNHEKFRVVSSDDLVMELATKNHVSYEYVMENVDFNLIVDEMNYRLDYYVENGFDIILDRTNLTRWARQKFTRRFIGHYNVIGMHFNTDIDTILERNKSREDKMIPENILYNMIGSFEAPEVWEGFDLIEEIRR